MVYQVIQQLNISHQAKKHQQALKIIQVVEINHLLLLLLLIKKLHYNHHIKLINYLMMRHSKIHVLEEKEYV